MCVCFFLKLLYCDLREISLILYVLRILHYFCFGGVFLEATPMPISERGMGVISDVEELKG